jgi:hypothetical protein
LSIKSRGDRVRERAFYSRMMALTLPVLLLAATAALVTADDFYTCLPGVKSIGGMSCAFSFNVRSTHIVYCTILHTYVCTYVYVRMWMYLRIHMPYFHVVLYRLVTTPKGDTHVKVGSAPFKIHCLLNPTHNYHTVSGLDSRNLEFQLAGDDGIPVRMDSEIVNETTISATFEPGTQERMDLISCRLNIGGGQQRAVCQQNVYVGRK